MLTPLSSITSPSLLHPKLTHTPFFPHLLPFQCHLLNLPPHSPASRTFISSTQHSSASHPPSSPVLPPHPTSSFPSLPNPYLIYTASLSIPSPSYLASHHRSVPLVSQTHILISPSPFLLVPHYPRIVFHLFVSIARPYYHLGISSLIIPPRPPLVITAANSPRTKGSTLHKNGRSLEGG